MKEVSLLSHLHMYTWMYESMYVSNDVWHIYVYQCSLIEHFKKLDCFISENVLKIMEWGCCHRSLSSWKDKFKRALSH